MARILHGLWGPKFYEKKQEKGNISLPEMINKTENYRKPRCLSWLENVKNSMCGNTTVVDTLLIRPGLSYWWMTIPWDYSFKKTSIAYATLSLWALAQIADVDHAEKLQVHGADVEVEKNLTLWCSETEGKIIFVDGHTKDIDESHVRTTYSHIERKLPPLVSGLGYLALHYLRSFTWRHHKLSSETVDDPALDVVDYCANIDVQAARAATYTSSY
jgi:surface carbohydrate biosynthesis protein (TIGR04326 family)